MKASVVHKIKPCKPVNDMRERELGFTIETRHTHVCTLTNLPWETYLRHQMEPYSSPSDF